jgi:ubiquinone/menaquinone biosynthesis C-methylase UbiE
MSFDRAVEYYDRTRGLSEEASREMAAILADEVRGRGRCLEVGVGTGLVALPLAEAGVPMVGVDISAPMLGKLVEKAGGHAPFPLVRADATALPFYDDAFGIAVVRHLLHLIPAWERAIAELRRVLHSGGAVLVATDSIPREWREVTDRFMELVGTPSYADGLRSWDQGNLDAAFAEHGARVRELRTIPEHLNQSLGGFLDQMADGLHSWTWEVDEEVRRRAAAEIREWSLERYGSLDPPSARNVTLRWRVYDLS